ncbi:hypothetical protein [uncultured Draconibacterium sp.]|uniref:hypothetical protein n=1 Tax=uncultured Draconibacterium sp. TaxID=1573823 RepID=UPI002AA664C5|nr:hypothetical protein [uncultured Draconibacterium sp.]
MKKFILLLPFLILFASCTTTYQSKATFPAADDLFITSGDGDITKPYTPVGQFIFMKSGFRIPLPLLGYLNMWDVDPDEVLKTEVYRKIREMGGDGLINMKISWTPPKDGIVGLGANGGYVLITGTVINR